MRRLLVAALPVALLATLTALTAGTATAAPVATAAPTTDLAVPDGLRLGPAGTERATGTFARGSVTAAFEARATSPITATATVTLNGKRVTATRDLRTGTATWSGAGAALVPEDREAAAGLATGLRTNWVDPAARGVRAVPGHKDLAVRLAMLLAEAPLGVALTEQSIARPVTRTAPVKYARDGNPRTEACIRDAIATTDRGTEQRSAAAAACQQSNEDGVLYFGSCATRGTWLCHDADSHCFLCETVTAGPGSTECMGECGPGCNGLNIYTYDCGDHDRCGRVHGGSLNPWDSECGDEYWEADDDFLLGWPNCT